MKLRRELEITAPAAGPSSEWSAAAELDEVEKLAAMGVVLQPREEIVPGKWKGKGKAKGLPTGHVVFADGRDECKSNSRSRLICSRIYNYKTNYWADRAGSSG